MFYLLLVQGAVKIPSIVTIIKAKDVRLASYLVGDCCNNV